MKIMDTMAIPGRCRNTYPSLHHASSWPRSRPSSAGPSGWARGRLLPGAWSGYVQWVVSGCCRRSGGIARNGNPSRKPRRSSSGLDAGARALRPDVRSFFSRYDQKAV